MGRRVTRRHLDRFDRSIPPQLRRLGYKDGPAAPLSSDDLDKGTQHRKPDTAFKFRFVEMVAENSYNGDYQDLDHDDAQERLLDCIDDGLILPPSYRTLNEHTGHVQVGWFFEAPVHNNAHSSRRALALYYAINAHHRRVLQGDPSFAGRVMRNPIHPSANARFGAKTGGYTLKELASVLPKAAPTVRKRGKTNYGNGYDLTRLRSEARAIANGFRNEWLANGAGRGWNEYTSVGGIMYVCDNIDNPIRELNDCFNEPMDQRRVTRIISSLERQRVRTLPKVTERRAYAAKGGRKSGAARRERTSDRDRLIVAEFDGSYGRMAELGRQHQLTRQAVRRILERNDLITPKARIEAEILERKAADHKVARIARDLNIGRGRVYRCLEKNGVTA